MVAKSIKSKRLIMKKTMIIIIAVLSLFQFSKALETSVLLGGGANSSSPASALGLDSTFTARLGWNAGILSELSFLGGFLSIQTGAQLETRGYDQTFTTTDTNSSKFPSEKTEVYFTYLHVPLFLQGNLNIGSVRLSVFGGPSLGILMSSSEKINYENDEDLDNITPFDLGWAGGFGAEWIMPRGAIYIRPEYYLGTKNTLHNHDAIFMKHKNIKLQMGFRYFIP